MSVPASDGFASVVICTFNGASRIGNVLSALTRQSSRRFEVLVIDNASTDDTPIAVERSQWTANLRDAHLTVRTVREEKQGLLFARLRGLREAKFEYVCFLDDDNVPEPLFVASGLRAFDNPSVGMLTSRVFPKYAITPPASMLRREHLLAINRNLGSTPIEWGSSGSCVPTIGAGMWLRRTAALEAIPLENPDALLTDRIGNQMMSGGDIEFGILMGLAGFNRRYEPSCEIVHLIPESRLTTKYFLHLIMGIVRSAATVKAKYDHQRVWPGAQAVALIRFAGCILALPMFLLRPDPLREALFALTARVAEVRGPYRKDAPG